jgi:predicted ester cyclase
MYEDHVAALIAAWNEGDLDGLDPYLDQNTIRRAPPSVSSDANNLAELKQAISDFRTTFPDAKVTIDEVHYQEDRSFAKWTFTGTNTGPGDFAPTGKAVTIQGSSFGHYSGGLLVEEHVYFDGFDMMSQLGLVPDPSEDG